MKPLFLAYYLPQYHPFPENDEWWGKGFTEWTNVAKARRLFPGHYQPHIPADLGFYDLRVPEVRKAQAELAREAGVDCFCYWHYWFNGHKMMERPFEEVVNSGEPDFPFCLSWANHSWYAKTWNKDIPDKLLIEQTYGGVKEYTEHFNYLLPAFKDKRYQRKDGKLVFGIYDPFGFKDVKTFMDTWNQLAKENGLEGFHFFAHTFKDNKVEELQGIGFSTVFMDYTFVRKSVGRWLGWLLLKLHLAPQIMPYMDYVRTYLSCYSDRQGISPQVLCSWDHTPRSGMRGYLFSGSTPERFGNFVDSLLAKIESFKNKPSFVMIKSWNEWGEGNYLEPDLKYGKGFIKALRAAIDKHK